MRDWKWRLSGQTSRSPRPRNLRVRERSIWHYICRDLPLTTVDAMRGRWTDVMIQLDARGGGILEIYLNGERKVRTTDFIRFQPRNYYVKYGLYRSFVSRHGSPMPTQVAVYDEVRMGNDRATVEVSLERPVD